MKDALPLAAFVLAIIGGIAVWEWFAARPMLTFWLVVAGGVCWVIWIWLQSRNDAASSRPNDDHRQNEGPFPPTSDRE